MWVVGEGDKVELRKVQVGRYLTGKIVVADGVKGGETVVVSGGQLLHPGMQVEKVSAKDGGAAP
ncbi:Multidrug resistance protein MdtA [compost metagenome]